LGDKAIDANAGDIVKLDAEVRAMLKGGGAPPAPPFADYETFKPAAQYTNRHTCVLLPIEALLKAFVERGSK
jgi:NifU-like protein involved in Fe-S cluster formation